jgi:hypothetical protein
MTKKTYSVKIGETTTRWKVRLEDENLSYDNVGLAQRQLLFCKELVDGGIYSGLLKCGNSMFDKMTIFHDGSRWVAELEAETED